MKMLIDRDIVKDCLEILSFAEIYVNTTSPQQREKIKDVYNTLRTMLTKPQWAVVNIFPRAIQDRTSIKTKLEAKVIQVFDVQQDALDARAKLLCKTGSTGIFSVVEVELQ